MRDGFRPLPLARARTRFSLRSPLARSCAPVWPAVVLARRVAGCGAGLSPVDNLSHFVFACCDKTSACHRSCVSVLC